MTACTQGLKASALYNNLGAVVHATADRLQHQEASVHLVFCLDASGSMSHHFTTVKKTLCDLLSTSATGRALAPTTLYRFSDETTVYNLSEMNLASQLRIASSLSVSGGTNFPSMLNAVKQQVEEAAAQACFFIVILSGECHNKALLAASHVALTKAVCKVCMIADETCRRRWLQHKPHAKSGQAARHTSLETSLPHSIEVMSMQAAHD